MRPKVCVLGGGGYVGSLLVPRLFQLGYEVTVLDTFWYGKEVLHPVSIRKANPAALIAGDIRSERDLGTAIVGCSAVINLACISNDPSFEMNPALGKAINYDAFATILKVVKRCNVKRFIYASSSSVYGVKDSDKVTEDMKCEPLTDYSKFKLMCEEDLKSHDMGSTDWTIVRPATICGWAPRMRLDLILNALTIHALVNKKIIVHGGDQLRPNISIRDMVKAYIAILEAPREKIHRQTFNVGGDNFSVNQLAALVKNTLNDQDIQIIREPIIDNRSYKVNSEKILRSIGFRPEHPFNGAISSILLSYHKLRNPLTNPYYYNIKRMKQLGLS